MTELPTIAEAVARMRAGQFTSLELIETCLAGIRRHDERLRAWVLVDEAGARRQAEAADQAAGRGELLGPLHGIPVGIKDIVDVAGMPTEAASPLRKDHVAERDAPLVVSLRRAGAVILGKTVTTQFACFDPAPTRNPWNLAHTPGGSSSGSAAAVAARMCLAAIGSQTGGSITRPATFCGVAGLKPTFAAISTARVVPVSAHLDHVGPIARCAGDLAAMWEALREGAPREGSGDDETPPRLGALGGFFEQAASDTVLAVTGPAIESLRSAGAVVEAIELPESFGDVHRLHRVIMAVDAARYHREQFTARPDAYRPKLASLIEEGLAADPDVYAKALAHQRQFAADFNPCWQTVDALVMPATNTTAPASLDTTGDPGFNSPWSHAGLPLVSIACGRGDDGMPCGLQLVGPAGSEDRLLRIAAWSEGQLGMMAPPPTFQQD